DHDEVAIAVCRDRRTPLERAADRVDLELAAERRAGAVEALADYLVGADARYVALPYDDEAGFGRRDGRHVRELGHRPAGGELGTDGHAQCVEALPADRGE